MKDSRTHMIDADSLQDPFADGNPTSVWISPGSRVSRAACTLLNDRATLYRNLVQMPRLPIPTVLRGQVWCVDSR